MAKKEKIAQLTEAYVNAVKSGNKDDCKILSELMCSPEIQSVINSELNNPDKSEYSKLIIILEVANLIDNNSEYYTGMTDVTYDTLYDKMNRIIDSASDLAAQVMKNPPPMTLEMFANMWFTTPVLASNGSKKVSHKYIGMRGTLDKIYYLTNEAGIERKINKSRKGLTHYINTTKRKLAEAGRSDIDVDDLLVYVFPKYDGVSAVFEFNADGTLDRVLTRGDTSKNLAEDVTHLFDFWVSGEPREHPYALKCEVHMEENDYLKYNEKYGTNFKSSRQIVNSIMNSDKPDKRIEYLHLVPLRLAEMVDGVEGEHVLSPKCFNYPYIKCKLSDTDKIEEFALSHKYAKGLRCDGAVIHIIDKDVQRILGRENDRDKFEVAYKFTEETEYSKVKDILFTPGIFGNITPTVVFEERNMKGNTVEKASLGSFAIANDLQLAKGDTIRIHYDIIPTIVFDESDPHCKRSGKSPIKMPTHCPECDEPLTIKDAILMCENPNCNCRVRGRIFNYCQSMGMVGIGEETIEDFYNEGFLDDGIKSLYSLKDNKKKLMNLKGYGKKSIKTVLDEIERTKHTDILTVLNSIGIKGVRGKTYSKIFDYGITWDELKEIVENNEVVKLVEIPGIGDVTSVMIIDGLKENKKLIKFLEKTLMINTVTEKRDKNNAKFNVVFSNIRDAEMEKEIESLGGVIGSGVTKKTNLLIVPDVGVTTTKASKARELGIPIVHIDDAIGYIKTNLL